MNAPQREKALSELLSQHERDPSILRPMTSRLRWLGEAVPLLNFNSVLYSNALQAADILSRPGFSSSMCSQMEGRMLLLVRQAITELKHDLTNPEADGKPTAPTPMPNQRHTVFLSHTATEAKLAIALKDWIESTFEIRVFVSSDKRDLRPGNKWLNEIDAVLNDAGALLVICSPHALTRPWIHFETGCAWIRRVPIIPICHSGLTKSQLAPPLSSFQALTLDEADFSKQLIQAVAAHFGITKIPRVSFADMDAGLRKCASTAETAAAIALTVKPSALSEDEIKILKCLSDAGDPGIIPNRIADHFGMNPTKVTHFCRKLQAAEYLYSPIMMDGISTYYLADAGRAFLVENNLV